MKELKDPYVQCELIEKSSLEHPMGGKHTTRWIPAKFANREKLIKIRDEEGNWKEWFVLKIGAVLEYSYLLRHERDFLKQREASDI